MSQIAILSEKGWTPSEIAALIPYSSMAHVHAALAYYFAHKDEIEADIAAEEEFYEKGVRGLLA